MDVKTIDSSSAYKKVGAIQIMGIRKLGDENESILHPMNQVPSRG